MCAPRRPLPASVVRVLHQERGAARHLGVAEREQEPFDAMASHGIVLLVIVDVGGDGAACQSILLFAEPRKADAGSD